MTMKKYRQKRTKFFKDELAKPHISNEYRESTQRLLVRNLSKLNRLEMEKAIAA